RDRSDARGPAAQGGRTDRWRGDGRFTMNCRPAAPLAAVALAAVLVSGCGGPDHSPAAASSPRGGPAPTAKPHEPPGVAGFHSVRTYDQLALPVRLQIPAIDVSTPLVKLGRLPDGSLEVPKDWDTAGWYDGGPRPGQPGPAVILGHVDSTTGPAVDRKSVV